MRFKNHGVAPKSAADFAFLLHGLHYLKDDGVMAIILPHGVLFRGGAEERIRRKLLEDGHIGLAEVPLQLGAVSDVRAVLVLQAEKLLDKLVLLQHRDARRGEQRLRAAGADFVIAPHTLVAEELAFVTAAVPTDGATGSALGRRAAFQRAAETLLKNVA